jgi:endonuclease/exonuclease/phosphatase (EEP) superfamily protein YafD
MRYPPLLLGVGLLVLALALCLARSRAILIAAIVATLTPASLMAPEVISAARAGPASSPGAPRLTLLSVNLWSRNQDHEAIVALIRREQPDIIVVQEAFGSWRPVLVSLAPNYRIVAGCHYEFDCNVVILTKLAFVDTIKPATFAFATARLELPQRVGGGAFEVMGVHLSHPSAGARERRQVQDIASISRGFSDRAFIAGDFNATPWSNTMRDLDRSSALQRRTHALFTWPTPAYAFTRWRFHTPVPVAPIDHVYAGSAWRLVEIRRGPNVGSDHYPVIAAFALNSTRPFR